MQTGSGQVVGGLKQLTDGAKELKDGTKKYNDEGIKKITNGLGGTLDDLSDVQDRLKAVTSDGLQYTNYSGIANGMDGTVKFVITTDAIKADK